MLCDFHVHTKFSADSEAEIDSVIETAISRGMNYLCITDHHDIDYDVPEDGMEFLLDPQEYYRTLSSYKEKYSDRIHLLIGLELGLQPHIKTQVQSFLEQIPLDFVIGSSHVINRIDPYYDTIWKNRTTEEVMQLYFENIYENLCVHDNFDVYGHIDYAIRYAKNKDDGYCYEIYEDILDKILKKIIALGKGIEINTGGLKKGLRSTNPSEEILKHYYDYGGRIITIGSDAHTAENVGSDFDTARAILRRCGFTQYHIFIDRKPVALPLS